MSTPPRHPSSERFVDVLCEMRDMHDVKQADYGTDVDPFANVRGCEELGIEAWVGAAVRMNDKMRRIQKAARGGRLHNESLEDSLLDLAVYAGIALVLLREQEPEPDPVTPVVLSVVPNTQSGGFIPQREEVS